MSDQSAVRDCHTFPINPYLLRIPCEMPSRDYCQRPFSDTGDLHGTSGNVCEDPAERIESGTPVYGGFLYGRSPVSRFDGSVFSGTGKLVAGSEEVNEDTISTPRLVRTSSTWKSPSHTEGVYPQSYIFEQQRLPISELYFDKFPTTFHILMLEDKSQNRSMRLFRLTLGGNVMDQRSGRS